MEAVYLSVLAHNLRLRRSELGETQREFAEASGLSYRLYQRLESGYGNPTMGSLLAIAQRFKMDITDLLRLKTLRVDSSMDAFVHSFRSEFESASFGAWVRTIDAKPIWSNKLCLEMHGLSDGRIPQDLSEVMSPEAIEAFKQQIRSQRMGISEPYTNSIRVHGQTLFFRYHPILIYESFSNSPALVACYMSEIHNQSEELYYQFSNSLIQSVRRISQSAAG